MSNGKQLGTQKCCRIKHCFPKLDHVKPLIDFGHNHFGENKVQEAKVKWSEIKKRNQNLNLHMVGKLQSNKAKDANPVPKYCGTCLCFRWVCAYPRQITSVPSRPSDACACPQGFGRGSRPKLCWPAPACPPAPPSRLCSCRGTAGTHQTWTYTAFFQPRTPPVHHFTPQLHRYE